MQSFLRPFHVPIHKMQKICCLGPAGTYTEEASLKFFGNASRPVLKRSLDEVFQSVSSAEADYAIVAAVNTREGVVTRTYDLLAAHELVIVGEVTLPIRHALLSRAHALSDIATVAGHAQALAQCTEWLSHHLPGRTQLSLSSNAEAARLASENPTSAALASERAAAAYGLNVLRREVQDDPQNATRFYVLARKDGTHPATTAQGAHKTTVLISLPNQSGALYRALEPFQAGNISLDSLHARPSRTKRWEYLFFLEFVNDVNAPQAAIALAKLATFAEVRILGSYGLPDMGVSSAPPQI